MLAHQEEKEKALCQAISLNLFCEKHKLTKLTTGDILEIDCDGFIRIIRDDKRLKFDLKLSEEENKVYYLGCRLDVQMVGMVKLLSALMGLKLTVLDAGKRQCRFLVSAKD